MVKLRGASRPETVVVKPARPGRRKKGPAKRCLHVTVDACRAELRSDHGPRESVCDCHSRAEYNPRHDPALDLRILCVLYLAAGEPVNLYAAFGCDSTWSNRDAFRCAVQRLNDSGIVRIVGVHSMGYKILTRRRRRPSG